MVNGVFYYICKYRGYLGFKLQLFDYWLNFLNSWLPKQLAKYSSNVPLSLFAAKAHSLHHGGTDIRTGT